MIIAIDIIRQSQQTFGGLAVSPTSVFLGTDGLCPLWVTVVMMWQGSQMLPSLYPDRGSHCHPLPPSRAHSPAWAVDHALLNL